MKLCLYQLQYAVTDEEYRAIKNNEMCIWDLPATKVAASLSKELDIGDQATPHIGDSICDTYWPSDECEQKVVNVCYSYSDGTCTVTLEPFVMSADSTLYVELEKIAALHGWKCQMMA